MGLNIGFSKSCILYGDRNKKPNCGGSIRDNEFNDEHTTGTLKIPKSAPPPNPNPLRWKLVKLEQYSNAYVMEVKYLDCTNFEGNKIMVYAGQYKHQENLDPHFGEDSDSPLARFKPDKNGWKNAIKFAESL